MSIGRNNGMKKSDQRSLLMVLQHPHARNTCWDS
ncbi:Uncharacterised protein [Vibrio cholerae]|nr:Uncharacterised protein [Vibrio cholerae]